MFESKAKQYTTTNDKQCSKLTRQLMFGNPQNHIGNSENISDPLFIQDQKCNRLSTNTLIDFQQITLGDQRRYNTESFSISDQAIMKKPSFLNKSLQYSTQKFENIWTFMLFDVCEG